MLPEWTPFDRADHVLFMREVRRALKDRAIPVPDAGLERGVVDLPAPHSSSWRLAPLAEACAGKNLDFWARLVSDDLERMMGAPPRSPRRPRPPRPESARVGSAAAAPDSLSGDLRVQLYARDNPATAVLSLDALVWRPLAGSLIEVAVWDVMGGASEVTVSARDGRLRGRDLDTIFAHGRGFAVEAMRDTPVEMFPIELAGVSAELAVSNGPYLGALMVEAMARMGPDCVYIAVPVSWHHWLQCLVTSRMTDTVLVELRRFAKQVLDKSELVASERLGDTVLWWPGGGRPDVVSFGPHGPALTDAMRATIAAAPVAW